jgi:hypothetical protein
MPLDLTGFGFVGMNWDDRSKLTSGSVGTLATFGYTKVGGYFVVGTAGGAITLNDAVCIDTTADDQYVSLASANSKLVAGVCIRVFDPAAEPTTIVNAVSGQRIAVLIAGVHSVVSDGTISRGDLVTISGTTAGRVIANNSAGAGTILGKALQAATAGTTLRILVGPR